MKDSSISQMVVVFLLLIGLMIGIGTLYYPAQGLPETDPEAQAILAAVQGLEDSRANPDRDRISDFAANDPSFHYGNSFNLKMVRMMLGKADLRAEDIGFLDFERAKIEYGRRVKELYLGAVARGYQPPNSLTPTPLPSEIPQSGGSMPTPLGPTFAAYPAYPYPKAASTLTTHPPDGFISRAFLDSMPLPLPAYPPPYPTQGQPLMPTSRPVLMGYFDWADIPEVQALADETGYPIPWSPDAPETWRHPLPKTVRLLGNRGYVMNGCVEEILSKINRRWMVIGESYANCRGG